MGRTPSKVWSYFSKNGDKIVTCQICSKDFKHCGNTSNAYKHLLSHGIQVGRTNKCSVASRRPERKSQPESPRVKSSVEHPRKSSVGFPRIRPLVEEQTEEPPEEMKIRVLTSNGISMTYLTKKREITFDMRDHIVKQVSLISEDEIVTMDDINGRYQLSAKKNSESNEEELVYQTEPETETDAAVREIETDSEQMPAIQIVEGTIRTEQVEEEQVTIETSKTYNGDVYL